MITKELMKETNQGNIYFYKFKNKNGMELTVTNYGAIIVTIKAPDKNGAIEEITLGFDDADGYLAGHPYFGCTAGRFANRIKNGKFMLNGKEYQLECNDGNNHLHGGIVGFDKRIWQDEIQGDMLSLTYISPDGEENYPAELKTEVKFSLTDANEVVIEYDAQSDGDTILNLTNHTYFNLNGKVDTILDHELVLYADKVTATDAELIPTGEIRDVAGTPMDFTTPHTIGERFRADYDLLKTAGGYDTNYILRGSGMQKAAELYDKASGRFMEVYTDQPAIQLYTSQALGEGIIGHDGKEYKPCGAVCLETQHYPDAPNRPEFPSTVLKKGDNFHSVTKYVFSVK